MARPQRNNVDYFPLYVDTGKKMFFIEQKYGNDGYATWIKLLSELAKTDYHFLNLKDNIQIMFLSAKCRIEKEVLLNIINDLVELGEFNPELWVEHILYSQKFTESIQDAYKKRSNSILAFEELIDHLKGLGVLKQSLEVSNSSVKPQSKVKNTKEENTKKYDYYIQLFNEVMKRDFKNLPPKGEKQLLALLQAGYKKDDFIKAMNNLKKDPKHIEEGFQYATPEFLSRFEVFERYLNVGVRKHKAPKEKKVSPVSKRNPDEPSLLANLKNQNQ